MESFLNIVWAALGLLLLCGWLRSDQQTDHGRGRQIVAILVLIAVLFPVISVSDDLVAMQGATEVTNSQKRDYLDPAGSHSLFPVIFAILPSLTAQAVFRMPSFVLSGTPSVAARDRLVSVDIQNRPPPAL